MDGWNTIVFLGWPIFRCYVSFRECTPPKTRKLRHQQSSWLKGKFSEVFGVFFFNASGFNLFSLSRKTSAGWFLQLARLTTSTVPIQKFLDVRDVLEVIFQTSNVSFRVCSKVVKIKTLKIHLY